MTHNLYFLINAKLDLVYEEFKIAYNHKTPIQIAYTIGLKMILDSKIAYIYSQNIHYCYELDFNLMSLGILKQKRF